MAEQPRRRLGRVLVGAAVVALIAAGCSDCPQDPSLTVNVNTLTVTPATISCIPGSLPNYTISWTLTYPVHRMVLHDDGAFPAGSRITDLNVEQGGTGSVVHAARCPDDAIGTFTVSLTATDQQPTADGGGLAPADAALTSKDAAYAQTQATFIPAPVPGGPVIKEFDVNGADHVSGTCNPKVAPPTVMLHWIVTGADTVSLDGGPVASHNTASLPVPCNGTTSFTLIARNAIAVDAKIVTTQFTPVIPRHQLKSPLAPSSLIEQRLNRFADLRPVITLFNAHPQLGPCNGFFGSGTTLLSWETTSADAVTLSSYQMSQSRHSVKSLQRVTHLFFSVPTFDYQVGEGVTCGGGLFGGTIFTLTATNKYGSVTSDLVVSLD